MPIPRPLLPLPPTRPRQVNRPLKSKRVKQLTPKTDRLMERIVKILAESEGKLTRAMLAREMGKTPEEISEYLRRYRSNPSSECALAMQEWAARNEKKPRKAKP